MPVFYGSMPIFGQLHESGERLAKLSIRGVSRLTTTVAKVKETDQPEIGDPAGNELILATIRVKGTLPAVREATACILEESCRVMSTLPIAALEPLNSVVAAHLSDCGFQTVGDLLTTPPVAVMTLAGLSGEELLWLNRLLCHCNMSQRAADADFKSRLRIYVPVYATAQMEWATATNGLRELADSHTLSVSGWEQVLLKHASHPRDCLYAVDCEFKGDIRAIAGLLDALPDYAREVLGRTPVKVFFDDEEALPILKAGLRTMGDVIACSRDEFAQLVPEPAEKVPNIAAVLESLHVSFTPA